MSRSDIAERAAELRRARAPYVHARVVLAERPTSAKPGDEALVLADGTIEGFVGGTCAQASVRLHAARALETGEAVLLKLYPGTGDDDVQEGVVVAHNPCLSGGSLEIFLDPHLAAPRVLIVGETPIARALDDVARAAGYAVSRGGEIDPQPSDAALVVASHGDDEELALARALQVGVGYVALVASPRRGTAVLESLDVDDALRSLVHTPAGLDIGARAPADIAISILAQMVAERTTHAPEAAEPEPVRTAVDPVCGMQVMISESSPQLCVGDGRVYFCCEGCRSTYAAEHAHAG